MICEWCGHEHAQDALCVRRPKWSRRGFLALFGAGIAVAAAGPVLDWIPTAPIVELGTCARHASGSTFRYVRAAADISIGAFVAHGRVKDLDDLAPLWEVSKTKSQADMIAGVATQSLRRGEHGWIQTWGPLAMNPQLNSFVKIAP